MAPSRSFTNRGVVHAVRFDWAISSQLQRRPAPHSPISRWAVKFGLYISAVRWLRSHVGGGNAIVYDWWHFGAEEGHSETTGARWWVTRVEHAFPQRPFSNGSVHSSVLSCYLLATHSTTNGRSSVFATGNASSWWQWVSIALLELNNWLPLAFGQTSYFLIWTTNRLSSMKQLIIKATKVIKAKND